MEPTFRPYDPSEADRLARWLSSDVWPFHGSPRPSCERARGWADDGRFHGPASRSFWIALGGEDVGLLAIQELDDPTPIFDLRLRSEARGRRLGRAALAFLTRHLFTETDKLRVEGHTRGDNVRMRRLFTACGWVKEAHHRQAWPDEQGGWHDAITYAVLRRDWETGERTPVPWSDAP